MPPTSRRRLALSFLALSLAAPCGARPLGAQILSLPKRAAEPAWWGSLNVGYFQTQDVVDGRTQTAWHFGDAVQYRGTLEYAVGRGSSVGVAGTWAHMPMRYEAFDAATGGSTLVDAHADVSSLMGTFHLGGGAGFHQVIDASLGVTQYANFRADQGGARLAPTRDSDLAFAIGYGFGYAPSERLELYLVQDYGNSFHQRVGLSNDARTSAQQLVTRVGARVGVGARRGTR